ncbi:MAG TPA: helix-turn-helix domain-containing protein [Streptosporangiaceae bacterium]|jgi:AcrR family transcriptional regulator
MTADQERPAARGYHSPRRAEQAAATRAAVLAAARELFVAQGYAGTTVAQIARQARVAVDTVYAAVGRKPALLRAVLETALSGTDAEVPARQRDYVRKVMAATSAREKITHYVTGLVEVHGRLAPVFLALRDAGGTDPESAALWQEIAQRRARNMADFAADLRATGELRDDLADRDVADIVWSMNSPEYWVLLVDERGWTTERFAAYLIDAWTRLLLSRP